MVCATTRSACRQAGACLRRGHGAQRWGKARGSPGRWVARAHQAAAEVVVQQQNGAKRRWSVKAFVHPSLAYKDERLERSERQCIVTNPEPRCTMRVCNGHIMQRQASGGHPSKRPSHGCRWRPKKSRRRCKADGTVKKNHAPAERGERSAHARGRSRTTRFFVASSGVWW